MAFPSTLLLNHHSSFSLFPTTTNLPLSNSSSSSSSLRFHSKLPVFSTSLSSSLSPLDDDDFVIGDCVVFDENAFEDPSLQYDDGEEEPPEPKRRFSPPAEENLVPEKWREVQAEINITKKERRKIAQEMEFGTRVEKNRQGMLPLRNVKLDDYLTYREAKLSQLNPVVLDKPTSFGDGNGGGGERGKDGGDGGFGGRVKARNPRWAVYGKGLDDVTEFFNSGNYDPDKKSLEPRKLFSKEEKVLMNSRTPNLEVATSEKWVPLHTLAASGEFYLLDALIKYNADVNAMDKDGWTAIHRAIIGNKQAVTNYLLRESANPFVRDQDGATLIHYAVRTASSQAIKILLLYNVDINLQDNDGWTPLHLAVQARRLDVVKLLLIKGADKTLKNKDGLTPLELCLYSGHETRTYELIKLLKLVPSRR